MDKYTKKPKNTLGKLNITKKLSYYNQKKKANPKQIFK